MKHSLTLVGGTLLALFGTCNASLIGICTRLTYADGGLYCRTTPDGGCLGDLGDFPVRRSFPWHGKHRINPTSGRKVNSLIEHMDLVQWGDDMNMYLLERTGNREYTKYKDQTYIDVSPGAFAPLRFTPDNSSLAEGETSWAFTAGYGFILWTPTGDPLDGTPQSGGKMVGQGFQMVDVPDHPGVKQTYWNQTLFDYMYEGHGPGQDLTFCNGDYDGTIIEGDRP